MPQISEKAYEKLKDAAVWPGIIFHDHPCGDAAIIAELTPFGFIQPEKTGWFEMGEAGYQFIEAHGISVWRFSGTKVAA